MADLTFAAAVRNVRRARGLTQAELAAAARLSRTQLTRIERAQVRPAPGTYARLIGALGFTVGNDLFAAAGDPEARQRVQWAEAEKARAAKARPETLVAPRQDALRSRGQTRRPSARGIEAMQTPPQRWRLLA